MHDYQLVDARTGANLGRVCTPTLLMMGDRVTHMGRAYVIQERQIDLQPGGLSRPFLMLRDDGPARSF